MLTISELARSIGFSRQYVQRCVKDGCPLDDFESARLWFQANRPNPKKEPKWPISSSKKSTMVDFSWQDDPELKELFETLKNSAMAAQAAWIMLDEAFTEKKVTRISVCLNLHSKAVEARVKAERMVREELERRGVLVPITQAKMQARRLCEIIVSRLSALPQNIAPRCNPHNPGHAMDILQEECTAILADAQKAMMP